MKLKKLQVTELDFNRIKENFISYLKDLRDENGEAVYTDYDFKGSALNTLLDVFAYNTHYNAMTAHLAVNESFIGSAQIRSNVVAAAKPLGYIPRSAHAATCQTFLRFPLIGSISTSNAPDSLFIPNTAIFRNNSDERGTLLWILRDGVTLKLVTELEEYRNIDSNGVEQPTIFTEGTRKILRYVANASNPNEKYVINDEAIDISTLIVRVYPAANSTSDILTYSRFASIAETDGSSTIYFLDENNEGKYEISFGNGNFGKALEPGNVIEIEYISTIGFGGNGISAPITLANTPSAIAGLTFPPRIITLAPSSGGSDRETIDSIRENATRSFITQNRAVTADDYKSIIISQFPAAESISVWGGDDNIPPVYGKVFVCVNKKQENENTEEAFLFEEEKQDLLNILRGKKVLSITPEIVDPEYINLVLDVLFKYDSNSTPLTRIELEQQIRENVVRRFNEDELNSFDRVFRYSNLTRSIDAFDRSILNSHVRVFVSKTFTIDPTSTGRNIVKYGTDLVVDDDRVIAGYVTYPAVDESGLPSSGSLTLGGVEIFIKDRRTRDRNIREIYTYSIDNEGNKREVTPNVGTINLSEGTLEFNNFGVCDENVQIAIDLIPRSNDIVSRRNQLIRIDVGRCVVQGSPDIIAIGGSSQSVRYTTFSRDR